MARPRKEVNQKQFETLCSIQCTKEEICSVLNVSEKTLNNWCKLVYGESFSLVFSQKRDFGKISLRRKQWESAQNGNCTMQIWLGKQLLGQSENKIADQIKLKELELKEREFALKEQLLKKQLDEEGNNNSDIAKAIRDVFGVVADEHNE